MKQKSENLRKYKVFENMGKEMSEETAVIKKFLKKYVKNYILVFSLLMLDFMGFFAYN